MIELVLLIAAFASTPGSGSAAAPAGVEAGTETTESRPATPAIRFVEVGAEAGARLLHHTRDFGERHKAEVLEMFTDGGAAVAVGDPDGDGDDDLFVVDSGEGQPHHLLLNGGPDENGVPRFVDVARAAGVAAGNDPSSICADALFWDFDNDGLEDLLVGRFGTPILYRNVGVRDGVPRFVDVSARVGLDAFGNTIAAVVFDADADGWLDLLLGNYFQAKNLLALETTKVLPNNLDYADNGGGVTFWRNVAAQAGGDPVTGGRRFVEQTRQAGFGHHTGWTLDLGHGDLDNDGDQDVYLAGDYGTDRLFLGRGDGTFEDVTEKALGFDTKKGMNVDLGDYDRNGFLDIYVTNITDEYMKECNMLWHNAGDGTFLEVARETGSCDTDWGWAAKFADFDNDGFEDLVATNGLRSAGEANYIPLLLETTIIAPGVDFSDLDAYPDIGDMTWSGYQRQRLFRNLGDGSFREMAAEAEIDNQLDGRGLAIADFDLDGRLDIFQSNARQPSLLYMNRSEQAGHWLGIRLRGTRSNRSAIGARVVVRAAGETFLREVNGGNGYSSASTTRLHFGLGAKGGVEAIEISWPSGRREAVRARPGEKLAVDRYLSFEESEEAP